MGASKGFTAKGLRLMSRAADEAGLEQGEDHDHHGEHCHQLTERQTLHSYFLASG